MKIPYILGKNENPENLFGIYVNTTGEIEWQRHFSLLYLAFE